MTMPSRHSRSDRPPFLVTGGCGFIGSHLVEALLARGAAVRVLDDLSTGRRENLPDGVETLIGDMRDPALLEEACAGVAGCFHLAAVASVQKCNEEWLESHSTNQSAFVRLLERSKPSNDDFPVVFASSAAVYGDPAQLPIAEDVATLPLSAYGADKLGCELHARAGAVVHGTRSIGLRFFNVYGPRQDPSSPYSGVISIFARRILAGEPVTVFGDGEQTRDFVFVKDVAAALLAAMKQAEEADGPLFEQVNVCTGRRTSILDLAGALMKVTGRQATLEHKSARTGDIRDSLGDPHKMQRYLGLSDVTDFETGLRTLVAEG